MVAQDASKHDMLKIRCAQQWRIQEALIPTVADRCLHACSSAVQNMFKSRVRCLCCVCCSPNVRVRVSLGGTSPRLRAMALDILGAVVPCPAPGPSSSPKSAEGAPERVLPAVGDGKLPAGPEPICELSACVVCKHASSCRARCAWTTERTESVSEFSRHVVCKHALSCRAWRTWTTTRLSVMCKKTRNGEMRARTHALGVNTVHVSGMAKGNHPKAMR